MVVGGQADGVDNLAMAPALFDVEHESVSSCEDEDVVQMDAEDEENVEEILNDEIANLSNDSFLTKWHLMENCNNRNISHIRFMLTNARSLSPKIISLNNYFDEFRLDFSIVSESWLSNGRELDGDLVDLEGSYIQK